MSPVVVLELAEARRGDLTCRAAISTDATLPLDYASGAIEVQPQVEVGCGHRRRV